MKNKISKIISSLLLISFLVSGFSVFAFANTEPPVIPEQDTENLKVIYNRDYQDGWDYDNGFSTRTKPYLTSASADSISIDKEADVIGNYNYFMRFKAQTKDAVYRSIDMGVDAVSKGNLSTIRGTVMEFSIKADDVANVGEIIWAHTSLQTRREVLLSINNDGDLIVFPNKSKINIGKISNDWTNIAFAFDWMQKEGEDKYFIACTIRVGNGLGNGYDTEHKVNIPYEMEGDIGFGTFVFGFAAFEAQKVKVSDTYTYSLPARIGGYDGIGKSYCLDNLKIYQGVTDVVELPKGYGSAINTLKEKVIDIQENANAKSKAQILEESLAMKVGVDYVLAKNVKYPLFANQKNSAYNNVYGKPVKQGDNVLVPLQMVLDYIGFPSYTHADGMSIDVTTGTSTTYISLGRDSATVDGKKIQLAVAPGTLKNTDGNDYIVVALSDIPALFPGWLAVYDDMGLILVYEDTTPDNSEDNAPIVDRNMSKDLEAMVNIMKKFVFDTVEQPTSTETYLATGEKVYKDAKANTNNFAHPYIISDAANFKKLADAYKLTEGAAGYNAKLNAYIKSALDQAEEIYKANTNSGTAYAGIKAPVIEEQGSDGYNKFGKLDELVACAEYLPVIAFAYQITGDEKYARFAYDWASAIGDFDHWGPGYFGDCAKITAALAISYDWLYNAYKALGKNTDALASDIYNLGVHDGYIISTGGVNEHPRSAGDLPAYNNATDHNNAVGAAGMIIGSLAILDYVDNENIPSDEANAFYETKYLVGNNIKSLIQNGLDIYAPDGSYIESPTIWEDATGNFFRMVMALDSATGSDYGFMNTWAMDQTCYYAYHIESSDGFVWNYHDSKNNGNDAAYLNTDMFNFVGMYLGDGNLIAIREEQIQKGKHTTIYDVLFYPDTIPEKEELPLNYYMKGIEGYVSRSDWSEGALYTGLMGGSNSAPNSQLDSGNFIYHNKGVIWICDLGTENPNIASYDVQSERYKYYRVSAEGQNVVYINSDDLPHGQNPNGGGFISTTYENEHGSYAILNNMSTLIDGISNANRGILITNDKKTVVIQDEISLNTIESLTWVIHTSQTIYLDPQNSRVAYLTAMGNDGKSYTLRISIVSPRPDFEFVLENAIDPVLKGTKTSNEIKDEPEDEPEYARNNLKRLVIKDEATIAFNIAVAFEIVSSDEDTTPVGYEWTSMNVWEPSVAKEGEDVDVVVKRGAPKVENIKEGTTLAETLLARQDAFNVRLEGIYNSLSLVAYTLKTFTPSTLDADLKQVYGKYMECVDKYDEFRDYANENAEIAQDIVNTLMGFEESMYNK